MSVHPINPKCVISHASVLLATLLFCLLLPCQAFAEVGEVMQAGAAKRSIVPPHPTKMGGYFDRTDTFTSVHTPVHVRALVCSNGEETVVLLASDLIGVSAELTQATRARIEEELGIPGGNVLLSATHNHSGPSGFTGMSPAGSADEDDALSEFLVAEFTAAVAEAQAQMRPAHLGYGSGEVAGLTRNRQQNNNEVIDPELGVLKLREADSRELIACVVNFTGHPVIQGSGNLELSSEYPGRVSTVIEELLGGVALFTQGACGDITMHRSGDPFDEIERIGNVIAGEAIKVLGKINPAAEFALLSRFEPVQVEPREVPSVEEATQDLEDARARVTRLEAEDAGERRLQNARRDATAAQTTLSLAQFVDLRPDLLEISSRASVHLMQLGPLVLVGIPGELFVEYQLEMKQRARLDAGRPLIVVGYANGYNGYIVTPRAKYTGGYEHAISRVSHTAGRTLTERAMSLLLDHASP